MTSTSDAPDESPYDLSDEAAELDSTRPGDADDDDNGEDDFPDQESTPIPTVIAWEQLDASDYARQLAELDDWVRWLSGTYSVEVSTVPNCWYRHPDLREELGHLHTGWSMTRHPEAGVGAIGLDWDRHRDITLARCKMITAAAGCTPTSGHRDRASRVWPADHQDNVDAHSAGQRAHRDSAGITAAAEHAAAEALAMADLADPPAAERSARTKAASAARIRKDATLSAQRTDALEQAEMRLASAIAEQITTNDADEQIATAVRLATAAWADTIARLEPAATNSAATDQPDRARVLDRHPGLGDLL